MTAPDAKPANARGFASDNYAGAHPEVLRALTEANAGHASAYGDDPLTARLSDVIRGHFGDHAHTFCVFNGTGANVVALQSACRPWEAVICARNAHIDADEGGAPERVAGIKLHTVDTPDGKLSAELIETQAWGFGFVHRAQPRVVSITQSSELGTVYTPDEIRAITTRAHELGMLVHLDGARISNAAASLGVPLRAFTTDVGVDLVSLGGTKNGAIAAEAVVVLEPSLADAVPFVRKTFMQLSSKMRFTSAQLIALFEGDLWLRSATHANTMAQRLAAGMATLDGVRVTQPVQANAVFAILPSDVTARLQERHHFYVWDHRTGEVRLMCSWDTTEGDVDAFITDVTAELHRGAP
jgi:threonine aldolase